MTLFLIIALAITFDFVNGFHDAANSVATIVSTRVLTPFQAVLWAASFNFIAFFVAKYFIREFGIAQTISKVVEEKFITLPIIFSGLVAAIFWNLFTWYIGIPSSSSHTLIGGFSGSAICATGFHSIHIAVIIKIISFIILAPFIGMITSIIVTISILWIFRKSDIKNTEKIFKKLQLISSSLFSLGHGLNDSQKEIGIIGAAMITVGKINSIQQIPDWIPIICFAAIGIGTMMGGWRIVKTMGTKITKVTALEGVCAETAGALTLFFTETLKIPVSTTHTITGSIMGVGSVKRLSAVRWDTTIYLFWTWIFTIPISAIFSGLIYFFVQFFSKILISN